MKLNEVSGSMPSMYDKKNSASFTDILTDQGKLFLELFAQLKIRIKDHLSTVGELLNELIVSKLPLVVNPRLLQ